MDQLRDIAQGYSEFLDQWNWNLHITLSFRRQRQLHLQSALKHARKYLHTIKKEYPKMRFAAALLATNGDGRRNHVHILICTDDRYPVDFDKINIYPVTHLWRKGTATATSNWRKGTITEYLTKRKNLNLSDPDSYDLDFFRPQLLRQLQQGESKWNLNGRY